MTAGSWISAITRIWPPHFGQTSGSTSYTSRMISRGPRAAKPRGVKIRPASHGLAPREVLRLNDHDSALR
jgi:hypothetical protein